MKFCSVKFARQFTETKYERMKGEDDTRKADGRLTYICTAAHALSALRKITGINGGATYEEWSEGLEQNKKYYEK